MSKSVNINFMKQQRRSKDIAIGGIAAHWYDNNTRKHRLAEMNSYAKEVANQIQDGCSVLEVAPGPGYLAIELAKLGKFKIIGLDISKAVLLIFHFQIICSISLSVLLPSKISKNLSKH